MVVLFDILNGLIMEVTAKITILIKDKLRENEPKHVFFELIERKQIITH